MALNERVTQYIDSVGDWRGDLLKELREVINSSVPSLVEDFKWGVPVWSNGKLVCAISAFKDHVKINFFKGVNLADPQKLFNNGLDSKEHRSIDFTEGDKLNMPGMIDLIKAAADFKK